MSLAVASPPSSLPLSVCLRVPLSFILRLSSYPLTYFLCSFAHPIRPHLLRVPASFSSAGDANSPRDVAAVRELLLRLKDLRAHPGIGVGEGHIGQTRQRGWAANCRGENFL